MEIRQATQIESAIIHYLIKKASLPVRVDQLYVRKMYDGEMGSFTIHFDPNNKGYNRKFGKEVSGYEFKDDDGVVVLVSLNVDHNGEPYEVDVWKTDFSPTISLKLPDFTEM